ncbi:BolA family protein [Thauera sinica]|uniref:BolA family protein n=1 Tax=Thauera sinica TaxID=2665146 RepID=A0ABW1AY86_9RHOO|nr:BolA family protein [Thauera sp. K11]ATE60223.1 BolA family transcriptional regulator [Thauera sp. K11]
MTIAEKIRARLAPLQPERIEIGDDSALHAGHAGARSGGGHYRLLIVSPHFEARNTVARHRMIYDALGDMMKTDIHALAIRALSAAEATKQLSHEEPR